MVRHNQKTKYRMFGCGMLRLKCQEKSNCRASEKYKGELKLFKKNQ
jgi:hypothetical protein